MNATDDLKPCPFCGSEAQRESNNSYNGDAMYDFMWFAVYCPKCGCAATPRYQTANEAIDAWNRRVETGKIENLCKLVIQLWSLLSVNGYGDEASEMLCDGADEIFDPKDIDRRIKELRRELGIGAEQ